LVSAPSSQAFVERLFSVCGMVTVGRRNRMDKSLHMRTIQRSLKCPALSGIHARRRLRPHLLRHQSHFDPSHDIEHMRVQFPYAFLPKFCSQPGSALDCWSHMSSKMNADVSRSRRLIVSRTWYVCWKINDSPEISCIRF